MRTSVVFTFTGKDRVGIVDEITERMLKFGTNVETSRMARLGGDFAILMLVSLPAGQFAQLDEYVHELNSAGYTVSARITEKESVRDKTGWASARIEVTGADHEGIVHQVAHYLSQQGISIESMETGVAPAPMSSTLLFSMQAVVAIPPALSNKKWMAELKEHAKQENVDISVEMK
jgi:glycine cleavage system transcriptional repressor